MSNSWELTKCDGGTERFGFCQECGLSVKETYYQHLKHRCVAANGTFYSIFTNEVFGHLDCLMKARETCK